MLIKISNVRLTCTYVFKSPKCKICFILYDSLSNLFHSDSAIPALLLMLSSSIYWFLYLVKEGKNKISSVYYFQTIVQKKVQIWQKSLQMILKEIIMIRELPREKKDNRRYNYLLGANSSNSSALNWIFLEEGNCHIKLLKYYKMTLKEGDLWPEGGCHPGVFCPTLSHLKWKNSMFYIIFEGRSYIF